MDYLWYGNADALAYSNKSIDFINAKNGLDNIYPGYNLDGTAYKDVTFTGAYATAAMASTDQDFVNDAYSKVVAMTTDAYFGSTLRVLYLLTLSGNLYSVDNFDNSLSTDENILKDDLTIYPNPTENFVNVNFDKETNNTLKVYTVNGKLLIHKVFEEQNAAINIASLTNGFYILYLNNKSYKLIKK